MTTALIDTDFTIDRVTGERGLIAEGLSSPNRFQEMAEKHKMSLYYKFVDPENAKKFDRPIVDVSAPRNLLDERDHVRAEAGMTHKGAMFGLNLGHFAGVQEPLPYMYTHHNFDFFVTGVGMATTLFFNYYISKCQIGGAVMGHPHTQWAHNIVFGAGMLRAAIGSSIACGGALYTYEYLYTHAPYFKIRDPSTNGWGRPWEEGQSTFAARLVSMMWIPVGAAFFTGTFKRFHFNTGVALFTGAVTEILRMGASGMHKMNLKERFAREDDKQGAVGSLSMGLKKKVDYATNTMPNELNSKYMNNTQLTLKEFGWIDNCFDNLPMGYVWRKERNYKYNWTFERNAIGEQKYKNRNAMWEMPMTILDARSHTDALDKKQTQNQLYAQAQAAH